MFFSFSKKKKTDINFHYVRFVISCALFHYLLQATILLTDLKKKKGFLLTLFRQKHTDVVEIKTKDFLELFTVMKQILFIVLKILLKSVNVRVLLITE